MPTTRELNVVEARVTEIEERFKQIGDAEERLALERKSLERELEVLLERGRVL